MLKNFQDIWQRNRGNWLFSVAFLIITTACVLWRFNLLPEIQLEPSTPYDEGIRRGRPQPIRLVFTIIAGKKLEQSPVEGMVAIYRPTSRIVDAGEPLKTIGFELEAGQVASVFVNDLRAGSYAPIVFLDINGNGRLDMSENGTPLEPMKTIEEALTSPPLTISEKNVFQLEQATENNIVVFF